MFAFLGTSVSIDLLWPKVPKDEESCFKQYAYEEISKIIRGKS